MVYAGFWYGTTGVITKAKAALDPSMVDAGDVAKVFDQPQMLGANLRAGVIAVYPGTDLPVPFTVSEFHHIGHFKVELAFESPEQLSDAIKKAEKAVDKLEADRTLGGAVDFSYMQRFDVPPSLSPRFYTWSILVEVTFRKVI